MDPETIRSLVQPEYIPDDAEGFRYCRMPDCPTVYFRAGHANIPKDALTVRVGLKETTDPIPVCYCFDITQRDIAEEIAATGRATASKRITKLMKTDNCDCLHKNPSGRCCLGEVKAVEKALSQDTNR